MALRRYEIYRGDTPLFRFHVLNADRSNFNLSGWTGYFSAKPLTGGSTIFNRSCTLTDPINGWIQCRLQTTDSTPAGTYLAELELRNASQGRVTTAVQIELYIKGDVRV
jgi:hypothetical protein